MSPRLSVVGEISMVSAGTNNSTLEIGDVACIIPVTYVLAIQREKSIFQESELKLTDYATFQREIPQPSIYEGLQITAECCSPVICVQNVSIRNTVSSSIVQLGSTEMIQAKTVIKHIRHLLRERESP